MLIKCERHKQEDLELYESYAVLDKEAAKNLNQNKTDRTIESIYNCLKEKKSYISVSWGKDSVVLSHLAYKTGLKPFFVWLKESPMFNPYCETVRDSFLQKYDIDYYEIVIDYGRKGFGPFLDKNGDSILFHSIAESLYPAFGRRITGIRNEESNKRLLRYKKYGEKTSKTMAPLSLWKASEIFAYIEKNNLPLHPNYGMLGAGRYKRGKIRTDCLAGTQGDGVGRIEWEKEYYGDVINRIERNSSKTFGIG